MRALSTSELLGVWDRGRLQPPVQRALTLLAAACPETPADELAKLSIGQRDACLLTLREWTFGPQLTAAASCGGCGERLELSCSVADIRVAPQVEPAETYPLSVEGYELHFRLPNSLDLTVSAEDNDVEVFRSRLLEHCLLTAHQDGKETALEQLPAKVLDAVVERMAEVDPQAEVYLSVSCPSCSHPWQAAFDIATFFWSEINAWAHRMLREVHTLASVYGWSEAAILAVSPWRRQVYLELVHR